MIPYILRFDIFLGFSDASFFSTFYLTWIVLGQPPLQWKVEDKPHHLKQIQEKVKPLKTNTKPTNHPIEKEKSSSKHIFLRLPYEFSRM